MLKENVLRKAALLFDSYPPFHGSAIAKELGIKEKRDKVPLLKFLCKVRTIRYERNHAYNCIHRRFSDIPFDWLRVISNGICFFPAGQLFGKDSELPAFVETALAGMIATAYNEQQHRGMINLGKSFSYAFLGFFSLHFGVHAAESILGQPQLLGPYEDAIIGRVGVYGGALLGWMVEYAKIKPYECSSKNQSDLRLETHAKYVRGIDALVEKFAEKEINTVQPL